MQASGLVELSDTPFGRLAYVARQLQREARTFRWPNKRYAKDPVRFAREVLGVEPWSKQIEILEAVRDHKRVAVRSGHKVSKSHSAAILALWFYCSFEDARVVMTSVTARQVDEILWREVKRLHARSKLPVDGTPRELARSGLRSGFREITGFTAKEPEAVAGISGANVLYIGDEASGIGDPIFEAIEGNRAGGARLALFSNPTRTEGYYFEAFDSKAAFWKLIHVSSEDSPNVVEGRDVIPGLATREWVEEKREEWGEESALYKVRVRGEFVRTEDGKILSLGLLEDAELRWHDTPAEGRLQVGIDPAGPGLGGDESAFAWRRGKRLVGLQTFRGISAGAHVGHLVGLLRAERKPRDLRPLVVIDREGPIGGEIFGLLRAYQSQHPEAFDLLGVKASDRATRSFDYDRRRDELWKNLEDWFRAGGAIFEDSKLVRDLHAPSWIGQVNGKVKATGKDELRKMLGRSPDRADALALAVWEPASMAAIVPGSVPEPDRVERSVGESRGSAMDPYAGLDVWGRR